MDYVRNTVYGAVEGYEEDGMCKWLGIPYAKPPVGELRFKRAVPCEPWEGVKPAKTFGNRPVQYQKSGAATQLPESEDCLYLNVWAPKEAKKAPVFVWIYGGGGHGGEGSAVSYNGTGFAQDGVIYVNFNYRLGPLGFYNFSLYDKSFDTNCALSDVLLALKWVKENIASFGGDPDNITIGGHSAGASMVFTLLATPSAKGLFQKAISMSPTITSGGQDITHDTNNRAFLKNLNLTTEEVGKLKELPMEEIKEAAMPVFAQGWMARAANTFSFCVTDDLLPVPVYEALEAGAGEGVSVIFGYCLNEGSGFYNLGMYPTTRQELLDLLEYSGCPEKIKEVDQIYPGNDAATMKRLGGDLAFGSEVAKGLEAQTKYARTYAYRYDFLIDKSVEEGGMGACHGSEVETALHTYGTITKGLYGEEAVERAKERREQMGEKMHGAWIDFCKTGNPDEHLTVKWLPYTEQKKYVYLFNETCSLAEDPDGAAHALINEIDYYAERQGSSRILSEERKEAAKEFVLP